jgi:RNA-binding protein
VSLVDKKRIRELKGRAQALDSTVYVGKDGISGSIREEVAAQLKNKKLIKVRLLPSYEGDRREGAQELARACDATLVEVRGRTIVLAKD